MASATKQGAAMLRGFVRKTRFDTGLGKKSDQIYLNIIFFNKN